jgi:TetR/AcrR family fatty acid metabolism transcriptional regulator
LNAYCIRILDRVIMEGMESGDFRTDIDPYSLRSSMPGAMEDVVTNWLMLGHPENLLD